MKNSCLIFTFFLFLTQSARGQMVEIFHNLEIDTLRNHNDSIRIYVNATNSETIIFRKGKDFVDASHANVGDFKNPKYVKFIHGIKDFTKAMKLFMFLSENSKFEYGLSGFLLNGESTYAISTSMDYDVNFAQVYIETKFLKEYKNCNLVFSLHSHPFREGILKDPPSGYSSFLGDKHYYISIRKKFPNKIITKDFWVYDINSNLFFKYNNKNYLETRISGRNYHRYLNKLKASSNFTINISKNK